MKNFRKIKKMGINPFNTFKKYKEYIFGYTSFLGFICTFIFLCYAIYKDQWDFSFTFVVVLLAIINGCLAITVILSMDIYNKTLRELDNIKNKESTFNTQKEKLSIEKFNSIKIQEVISNTLHNILHESRYIVNDIHTEQEMLSKEIFFYIKEEKTNIEYDENKIILLQKEFEKYIIYLLDNLKNIFEITTTDICRICLKIILVGEETTEQCDSDLRDVHIKTYMRDSGSFRDSQRIDESVPSFPYHENSAFYKILESRFPDSWFLKNDLPSCRDYRNLRPNWNKDYNATLVVPIRCRIEPNVYTVIGFLCVDNKKGGFREEVDKEVLASIGDHLYYVFRSFNYLKELVKIKNSIIS